MSAQGLSHKVPVTRSSSSTPPSIPSGTTTGDLLYWDQDDEEWKVLPAASATGTFVLGSVSGVLTWLETDGCP
jgi:hypothetical protein